MITQVLQQLDDLRRYLARIDPAHELDAADQVAEIAKALRQTLRDATSLAKTKTPRDQRAAA